MDDPYAGVDWPDTRYLHSVSHEHTHAPDTDGGMQWPDGEPWSTPAEVFDSLYDRGIRHFALANYHPAKPTYPLGDYFDDVPADALGCPNAEHSGADPGHYCGIGSTYTSVNSTCEASWEELVEGILDALVYDDGGGAVLNHPRRSGLSVETVQQRLDFDPRVLGIEVWNHRGVADPDYGGRGNAVSTWDELLTRGRSVLGFFNPDYHAPWNESRWGEPARGRNVLLVEALTERAAARAYREGRFYGALDGTGLRFERIEATDGGVAVETNRDAWIQFVTRGQVVAARHGREAAYAPDEADPYVRVEPHDETGERLFSQPFLLEGTDRRPDA